MQKEMGICLKDASLLHMLKEARVDLLSCSGFPKDRRAQVDFIPDDPDQTAAKVEL